MSPVQFEAFLAGTLNALKSSLAEGAVAISKLGVDQFDEDDVRAFELPGSALRLDFLGTILPWPVFGAEGVACIDVALNVAAD